MSKNGDTVTGPYHPGPASPRESPGQSKLRFRSAKRLSPGPMESAWGTTGRNTRVTFCLPHLPD